MRRESENRGDGEWAIRKRQIEIAPIQNTGEGPMVELGVQFQQKSKIAVEVDNARVVQRLLPLIPYPPGVATHSREVFSAMAVFTDLAVSMNKSKEQPGDLAT